MKYKVAYNLDLPGDRHFGRLKKFAGPELGPDVQKVRRQDTLRDVEFLFSDVFAEQFDRGWQVGLFQWGLFQWYFCQLGLLFEVSQQRAIGGEALYFRRELKSQGVV